MVASKSRSVMPRTTLDESKKLFWTLTRFILADRATFDDHRALTFDLHRPPKDGVKSGRYHLISKTQENVPGEFLYRALSPSRRMGA